MNHPTPPTGTTEAPPPPNTNNTLTTFNPSAIAIINTHPTTLTTHVATPPLGLTTTTPDQNDPNTLLTLISNNLFEQVTSWFLESKYPATSPASPNTLE